MFGVQMLRCLYPMECVVKYLEHEKEAGSLELGLVSMFILGAIYLVLIFSGKCYCSHTVLFFILQSGSSNAKKKIKKHYIVILRIIIHCKTFSSAAYIDISKTMSEGKKDAW